MASRTLRVVVPLIVLAACGGTEPIPSTELSPPKVPLVAHAEPLPGATKNGGVTEKLFGTEVSDPFRYLEDGDSKETAVYTSDENARTRGYVDALKERGEILPVVRDLVQMGSVGAPSVRQSPADAKSGSKEVTRYFFTKREGAQNQPTLYLREGATTKTLLDVSALSSDGTVSLDWWYPSWDGALLAWGSSESGNEESTLRIRDVASGKDLADTIPHTRYASIGWLPDKSGFYYTRYPDAGTVPKGDEKYFRKIFFHKLGDASKADLEVFGSGRNKTDSPSLVISENGRYLAVMVHEGWAKSEVYLLDRSKGEKAAFVDVAVGTESINSPFFAYGKLYLQTNEGAPRGKLVEVNLASPEKAKWKEVIREGADILRDVTPIGGELVATYLHDASTTLKRHAQNGKELGTVALPAIGSASVSGLERRNEAFVSFVSYAVPPRVYRAPSLRAGKLETIWDSVGKGFDAKGIRVELQYAVSKDGTKVPMFLVGKEEAFKAEAKPTVLYGYGGFNVNQTPSFSARALSVASRGGLWAHAILRGGGEFGEDWHKAGMLGNKQNVFDDFYACAETLIQKKLTSADKLGIMGGSNGGLLTATAVTQRPELFRAALSLVPLTDMVRYHRFRIAKLWIPEYGDPEKESDFKTLFAYSPYHHIKPGTKYPAVLFTTAESDSRVDPMHARKMAARLREAQSDPSRPILLRVETKAGHGAGKPTSKLVEELGDELGFLFHELGL